MGVYSSITAAMALRCWQVSRCCSTAVSSFLQEQQKEWWYQSIGMKDAVSGTINYDDADHRYHWNTCCRIIVTINRRRQRTAFAVTKNSNGDLGGKNASFKPWKKFEKQSTWGGVGWYAGETYASDAAKNWKNSTRGGGVGIRQSHQWHHANILRMRGEVVV